MAFPNVSDIVATTIQNRSGVLADNVTKNNAALARMSKKGKVKTFSGGDVILQELTYAENGNASWYSGYDLLPVAQQDVISSAQYAIKQLAVPIVISGLEMLQNSGEQKIIDLLEGRVGVAEATMKNRLAEGFYSDGTNYGGKQLNGLGAAVVTSPTTGVYGGIDRALWPFWRNQTQASGGITSGNVQAQMNAMWVKLVRGMDRPDIILADNTVWTAFTTSLQLIQRLTDPASASLGFPSVKFMDADVVLDGGIGGFAPAGTAYFLNTEYLFMRPHSERNMVAIGPDKRAATNQDAEVTVLGWAGNLAVSNLSLQGILT